MIKLEVTGRVVGHQLFCPNPKDAPGVELVKVGIVLSPGTDKAEKHTKAVLVVEKDSIWEDFVIGRSVLITITEYQGDLFLPATSSKGDELPGTLVTVTKGETTVTMADGKGGTQTLPLTELAERAGAQRRGSGRKGSTKH